MRKPHTGDWPSFDLFELRKALGCFVTGVTVVTTLDQDKRPWGFTANSFASVSLDPPIVLACLNRSANSYPVFSKAQSFAVNVLSDGQRIASGRFASKLSDKFEGMSWYAGSTGSPLLADSAATFECRKHEEVEAGDHVVLFGRVVAFSHSPRSPLGYHAGAYVSFGLERQAREANGETSEIGGIFEKDGKVLLVRKGNDIGLPTAATLGEHRAEPGSLTSLLRDAGVRAGISFIYAVAHERGTGRLLIYYRGEILDGPDAAAEDVWLTPFEDIPWHRLPKIPNQERMLRRYIKERLEDRFGIYFGNVGEGSVQHLIQAG